MILYHGTNKAFDTIDLTKSKPNKDFGQGFYLSREYSQAMEMAKTKFDQIKTGFPTVLTYEVDEQQMNQLKVLRFDAYTFEWAQFILMNRRNDTNKPMHDYDIVYGPIADDRVGLQLQRFRQHYIRIEQLIEELKYKKPTFQFFFGTNNAISNLIKIKFAPMFPVFLSQIEFLYEE